VVGCWYEDVHLNSRRDNVNCEVQVSLRPWLVVGTKMYT